MTTPTESLTLRATQRAHGAVVDIPARDLATGAQSGSALPRRIHPLMAAAAVSVIVLCGTGVAALTGLIGPRHADEAAVAAVAAPARAAVTAPATAAIPSPATAAAHAPTAAVAAMPAPAVAEPVAPAPVAQRPATKPAPRPVARVDAPQAPAVAAAPVRAADWGVVQAVREVKVDAQPSAVGTVAGGVLGAVLGHQMGKGNGRDVGTVLGGIGGAFAGRAIESKARATSHWEMTVRLDDGSTRTFNRGAPWSFQAGERVHLVDGQPTGRG